METNDRVLLIALKNKLLFITLLFSILCSPGAAQKAPAILFPGINGDKPNAIMGEHYFTYLAELAPKLKGFGIDAVWVSPLLSLVKKNSQPMARNSYKTQYLKMVSALQANGVGVIYDLSSLSDLDSRGAQPDHIVFPHADTFDRSAAVQVASTKKTETARTERLSFGHDDFLSL